MSKFNYDFNKPRTVDEMWRAREIELLEEILEQLKKLNKTEQLLGAPGEIAIIEANKPQRKPRAKKV